MSLFSATLLSATFGKDVAEQPVWERLYSNGSVFPFGLYSVETKENMAAVRADGFNFIQTYGTQSVEWVRLAAEAGLGVAVHVGPSLKKDEKDVAEPFNKDVHLKAFAEDFNRFKDEQNIVCWAIPEEQRWWRGSEMTLVKEYASYIHNNDPRKRPVGMYQAGHYDIQGLVRYVPHLDWLNKGVYTVYAGRDTCRAWVGKQVDDLTSALHLGSQPWPIRGAKGRMPMAVLELFSEFPKYQPDLRLNARKAYHDTYASIVAGAKGIFVFSHFHRVRTDGAYDGFKQAAGEIAAGLGEIIVAGAPRDGVSVEIVQGPVEIPADIPQLTDDSYPAGPAPTMRPSVRFAVWDHAGMTTLIAVNSANVPVHARVRLPYPALASVECPYEKRTVKADAGVFEDNFEPLAVHIYRTPCFRLNFAGVRRAYLRGETIDARMALSIPAGFDASTLKVSMAFPGLEEEQGAKPTGRDGGFEVNFPVASKGLRPDAYYARFRLMRGNEILTEHRERFVVVQPAPKDGINVSLWPDNAVGDAFAAGNGAAFINYFNSLGFNEHCLYWEDQHECAHNATESKNMLRDIFDTALEQGVVMGMTASTIPVTTNVAEACLLSSDGKLQAKASASQFTPQRIELTKKLAADILAEANQFPAFQRLFMNSEAEDRLGMDYNPAARERIEAALGFKLSEPLGEPKYIAEGVINANDRRLRYERVRWKLGDGWVFGNATLAQAVRSGKPDVRAWSDPLRNGMVLGRFDGLDEVSTWTYTNPDLKGMVSGVETLFAEARGTKMGVRQSITFYNYAGSLTPSSNRWDSDKTFCMEADRATILGWVLLARRIDTLSYYYSSLLNPFMHRGYTFTEREKLQFSPATSAAIGRFNTEIVRPFGPLVKSLERPKRAAAVLSSFSSQVYRKSPILNGHYPAEQIRHFYSLLAMNNIPADVVFDEQIEQGCLKDYTALFLPKCDTLTETCWKNILEFQKAGGLVVADQYLRADIPGAIRVDYDFTYRDRVTANALNLKMDFQVKDDLATRKEHEKEKIEAGVDAQEDQRRMEQYAAQLRSTIGAKMDMLSDFGADTPTALCHLLRKGQTEYLFVANDKRTYGPRGTKWKSVLDQGVAQKVAITLREAPHRVAFYDLLSGEKLAVERKGGFNVLAVDLKPAWGTIIAVYPCEVETVAINAPERIKRGETLTVKASVSGKKGTAIEGVVPFHIVLQDESGRVAVDRYCAAENGAISLAYELARNDLPGRWCAWVKDFATGKIVQRIVVVE